MLVIHEQEIKVTSSEDIIIEYEINISEDASDENIEHEITTSEDSSVQEIEIIATKAKSVKKSQIIEM